jgi:hypothetical protein
VPLGFAAHVRSKRYLDRLARPRQQARLGQAPFIQCNHLGNRGRLLHHHQLFTNTQKGWYETEAPFNRHYTENAQSLTTVHHHLRLVKRRSNAILGWALSSSTSSPSFTFPTVFSLLLAKLSPKKLRLESLMYASSSLKRTRPFDSLLYRLETQQPSGLHLPTF